jgi:hypothetical protein
MDFFIMGVFVGFEPPDEDLGVEPPKDLKFLKGKPSDGFLAKKDTGNPISPLSDELCSS